MTTIRLLEATAKTDVLHKQDSIREIDFTRVAEYAVILPVGIEIEGNTYTVHRSDTAASRWAMRLAKKRKITVVVVDKKGLIYQPVRDTETGKHGLIPTNKTLENITIY